MKAPILDFFLLAAIVMMSSCGVVTGIFKAGMGFGIFIVVAIIALVIWLISKGRSR